MLLNYIPPQQHSQALAKPAHHLTGTVGAKKCWHFSLFLLSKNNFSNLTSSRHFDWSFRRSYTWVEKIFSFQCRKRGCRCNAIEGGSFFKYELSVERRTSLTSIPIVNFPTLLTCCVRSPGHPCCDVITLCFAALYVRWAVWTVFTLSSLLTSQCVVWHCRLLFPLSCVKYMTIHSTSTIVYATRLPTN